MSPNTHNPISVFQYAHDVHLDHSMISIVSIILSAEAKMFTDVVVSDPLAYAIQC